MPEQDTDIRWEQRFNNFQRALKKLTEATAYVREEQSKGAQFKNMDDLKLEGLIQRFEYTHELAWNVMKDYAIYQGDNSLTGSRDAIRTALAMGLITDKRWMHTIADRNRTSHTYNEETAYEIIQDVVCIYYKLFTDFEQRMEAIKLAEH
ncbi:MAG: nucleotidyltransferase substrate binding protein [Marinifilaceae bacterium]